MKTIVLTDAQWVQWQASATYRAGYTAGAQYSLPWDVLTVELMQPDGVTLIAKVTRQVAWA